MSQVDRQQVALYTIKNSQETPFWDGGVKPFLVHHLDVIDGSYWEGEIGTPNPSYSDVLEIIMFKQYSEDNQALDFTLPGNVTDYVIRVEFSQTDEVLNISTLAN